MTWLMCSDGRKHATDRLSDRDVAHCLMLCGQVLAVVITSARATRTTPRCDMCLRVFDYREVLQTLRRGA